MLTFTRITFTVAILALVVLAAGCGSDRVVGTGPEHGYGSASEWSVEVGGTPEARGQIEQSPRAAAEAVEVTPGALATAEAHPVMSLPSSGAAGSVTKRISAQVGGVVAHDRFRVTIPPGALSVDTDITIRTLGNGYLMCELEPHGIQFNVPVTLEVDVHGTAIQPNEILSIYWLNQTTNLWEDQFATNSGTWVSVPLGHFSKYAGGRSGW